MSTLIYRQRTDWQTIKHWYIGNAWMDRQTVENWYIDNGRTNTRLNTDISTADGRTDRRSNTDPQTVNKHANDHVRLSINRCITRRYLSLSPYLLIMVSRSSHFKNFIDPPLQGSIKLRQRCIFSEYAYL